MKTFLTKQTRINATETGDIGTSRNSHRLSQAAALLFFVIMALSVYLVKLGFWGVPVRAVVAIGCLLVIVICRPGLVADAISTTFWGLLLIAAAAGLGIFASLLNGVGAEQITRQVIEIHIQAAVGLLLGVCFLRLCGHATIYRLFLIVILISSLVAGLQFIGVDAAWNLRAALSQIQPVEGTSDAITLLLRERATGLSFSPVHLGTQLCILFSAGVAYYAYSDEDRFESGIDARILALFTFVAIASIISGNRSPLLGLVVFVALYITRTRPHVAVLSACVAAPSFLLFEHILSMLQDVGLRVAETDDGSAMARTTLRMYGLQLILEQPTGRGLTFNSVDHWSAHWSFVRLMPNPAAVAHHALHNYYLVTINKYGIGVLIIALICAARWLRRWPIWLGLTPYLVHIFYHNDGPLQGDFIIWYLLPLYGVLLERGRETCRTMVTGHR